MSLTSWDAKMITKYQQTEYIKRIVHHNQVAFIPIMQRWFNVWNSISVIYHINEKENYRVMSIGQEKASDKIQHQFMKKIFNNLRIEWNCLQMIKSMCQKSVDNIMLNCERLFSLEYQEQDKDICYYHTYLTKYWMF